MKFDGVFGDGEPRRNLFVACAAGEFGEHVHLAGGEPVRAAQFRERRRAYEQRVEAVLHAGVESGEFRAVEPRLTAMAWLGMHNYTYLWLKAGGRLSARDVAKPFADIFMRGISNPAPGGHD